MDPFGIDWNMDGTVDPLESFLTYKTVTDAIDEEGRDADEVSSSQE